MANELRDLVNKIQFVHDLTIEQVAKSIGYSRVHLSKQMKKDNKDFVKLLYKEYPDILHDVPGKAEKQIPVDITESAMLTELIQVQAEVNVLTGYVIDLMASSPSDKTKILKSFLLETKKAVTTLTKKVSHGGA